MSETVRPTERGTPALATVAATAEFSRGRLHFEDGNARADPFAVDRQRIITSSAFRRLQYKTQVFVYDEHDHFRTRLTHTLEVAEIARRLAIELGLNESLAEAIALAHDLGHAPFGHAGEAMLSALMADAGGFEHNLQSLRVVDYLEHPFPAFRGLNLTFELREGLVKHYSTYDVPDEHSEIAEARELMEVGRWPTPEAQVVSIADRFAYDCHDLEDALGASLITLDMLSELALWRDVWNPLHAAHPGASVHALRRPALSDMLDRLISDVCESTHRRMSDSNVRTVDDIRNLDTPIVTISPASETLIGELEGFLAERVYRHHRLVRMDAKARRFIERLFSAYVSDPALLPPRYARRVDEQGDRRVVCDYIAGMTDRFCLDEYKRLFQPDERA